MAILRSASGLLLAALVAPGCSTTHDHVSTLGASDGVESALESPLESIRAADIQTHVDFLASDELAGRFARSPEGRQAAEYIRKHFEACGLEPLGDDGTFLQALPDEDLSPNVVGIVRGTGSGYFVLTAHYDHLRPTPVEEGDEESEEGADRIFNGADDNASGTAAILELAQAFALRSDELDASLVFIAFTAEELGLRGSRHFVNHAPFDMEEIRGVLNLDMVSRGEDNLIFCEGGKQFPELAASARRANETIGLDIRFDEHPEWMGASDHAPFMRKGVPTLYFGVEDHADYHKVSDHADRILPKLTEKVTRLAYRIALDNAM